MLSTTPYFHFIFAGEATTCSWIQHTKKYLSPTQQPKTETTFPPVGAKHNNPLFGGGQLKKIITERTHPGAHLHNTKETRRHYSRRLGPSLLRMAAKNRESPLVRWFNSSNAIWFGWPEEETEVESTTTHYIPPPQRQHRPKTIESMGHVQECFHANDHLTTNGTARHGTEKGGRVGKRKKSNKTNKGRHSGKKETHVRGSLRWDDRDNPKLRPASWRMHTTINRSTSRTDALFAAHK